MTVGQTRSASIRDVGTMPSHDVFRFADFELDVDAYVLRRGGRPVRLEQQPMDLLILLVQRQPQLVTRAEIVERLWGADTFVEAETGINTAIRKVRQALGDSAASPTFIERVPGKGYRFAAEVAVEPGVGASAPDRSQPHDRPAGTTTAARVADTGKRRVLIATGVLVALIAAAVGFTLFTADDPQRARPTHTVPLTRLHGSERHPSLSPDGRWVAFGWDGEREDNFDIHVMLVGSDRVERLTTDPAAEFAPQWSPDGRQIAYLRVQPSGTSQQLRVMSALGGSDRAVSDFPAWYHASWSADGRYLAVGRASVPPAPPGGNGIYLIPLDGGEPRAITLPGASASDYQPAFSRDGRRLAYASCRDTTFRFDCHVQVVSLDVTLEAKGTPQRVTREPQGRISGITWTRDDGFIIYGAGLPVSQLWRVPADGSRPPERIEAAGEGAGFPTSSLSADALAFSRAFNDNDVYRFEPGREASPVARSTGQDTQLDFSPDGKKFAFCSDRSGRVEVWVAATDGSDASRLTRGPGRGQCSPAWSPDGQHIAFDSVADDGGSQIWTIGVNGGVPQPVTKGPVPRNVPRWSRDQQWIYSSSVQTSASNIWRTHVATGRVEQVTKNGSGLSSAESADGTGILYPASNADGPLMFQPHAGGAARTILPCVAGGSTVSARTEGIYYLPCVDRKTARAQPVHVFDPATGQDRVFGMLDGYYRPGDAYMASFRKVAFSPDGHVILYTRRLPAVSDLVLIEQFR